MGFSKRWLSNQGKPYDFSTMRRTCTDCGETKGVLEFHSRIDAHSLGGRRFGKLCLACMPKNPKRRTFTLLNQLTGEREVSELSPFDVARAELEAIHGPYASWPRTVHLAHSQRVYELTGDAALTARYLHAPQVQDTTPMDTLPMDYSNPLRQSQLDAMRRQIATTPAAIPFTTTTDPR